MSNNVKTLSPDTGLSSDLSISDLGKLVAGEKITPAVEAPKVEKTEPEVKPEVTPEPVAEAEQTPATEPETKPIEGEEKTPEPNQDQEKPKEKSTWVDKRLSQLAHQRKEERARADREQARAEQLQRELEALKAQPGSKQPAAEVAPPPTGKPKPQLKDFIAKLDPEKGEEYETAVERYTKAVLDWRDKSQAAERQASAEAESVKTQDEIFQKEIEDTLVTVPDFDDIRARVAKAASPGLPIAISNVQDVDGKNLWPKLVMHFDENPDELKALGAQFAQNPYAATAKLGRLAATLFPVAAPTPKPAAPPKKTLSKPPIAVGGTSTPAVIDLEKSSIDVLGREMAKLGL